MELDFPTLDVPRRRGLTRFEMMQMGALLSDLRAHYGFMCFELQYAIEEAIHSYGRRARGYVEWVFECEWDSSIWGWKQMLDDYDHEEVPDDDPGFDPRFLTTH